MCWMFRCKELGIKEAKYYCGRDCQSKFFIFVVCLLPFHPHEHSCYFISFIFGRSGMFLNHMGRLNGIDLLTNRFVLLEFSIANYKFILHNQNKTGNRCQTIPPGGLRNPFTSARKVNKPWIGMRAAINSAIRTTAFLTRWLVIVSRSRRIEYQLFSDEDHWKMPKCQRFFYFGCVMLIYLALLY